MLIVVVCNAVVATHYLRTPARLRLHLDCLRHDNIASDVVFTVETASATGDLSHTAYQVACLMHCMSHVCSLHNPNALPNRAYFERTPLLVTQAYGYFKRCVKSVQNLINVHFQEPLILVPARANATQCQRTPRTQPPLPALPCTATATKQQFCTCGSLALANALHSSLPVSTEAGTCPLKQRA